MMRDICIVVSLLLVLPPVCAQRSGLRHVSIKYHEEKKTWDEAQSFCREKHTDLATIKSEDDNQVLFGHGCAWIGLFLEFGTSTWKWPRDETPVFLNWDDNEPNHLQMEFCTCMAVNGKWHNTKCQNEHPFLCFDENLVLVKLNKTWEEALDHCRSLGGEDSENPDSEFWKPSYDLATLITDDDHDYARERAQQATTDEVWTGLRFLGDGWFWVGGEPVRYQDIPSCPAFSCGVLEKNSSRSFGIRDCSQRRNFFCYKRP